MVPGPSPTRRRSLVLPLVAVAAVLWAHPSGRQAQARDGVLRLVAYNIRHGEGMDRAVDLPRIAEVLRGLDADVIVLQEVDKGTARTGRVDQAAVIAERLGYRAVFGAHRPYQGGEYGNAVVTRLPVRASRTHAIPPASGSALAVLEVEVEVPGARPTSVVSVHLAGSVDDRLAQAETLTRTFAAAGRPVLLAGDFNSRPDDAAVVRLDADWRRLAKDGPRDTYPSDRPDREIDFVLASRGAGIDLLDHRVVPEAVASDHRPILAVLRLRPAARAGEGRAGVPPRPALDAGPFRRAEHVRPR